MSYRITKNAEGHLRWLSPGDSKPDDNTYVRLSTPEETDLIAQILKQDAAGKMPDINLGEALRSLFKKNGDLGSDAPDIECPDDADLPIGYPRK